MSKIGVGGVKLAMTEKGAVRGVPSCAMRREVKWRDGLWTGGENSCRCVTDPME